jgi:hypothetical protein
VHCRSLRQAQYVRQAIADRMAEFAPAISRDALDKISGEVRRWRLHRKTGQTFVELARWINPIVRGWMQYYGAFHRSALRGLLARINS